jgi:autotransporter-associated beta strand protein
MFRHLLGHDRKLRSLQRGVPASLRRQRACRPQLEALEQRLAPAQYFWSGEFGSLWSWHQNWNDQLLIGAYNGPPYGDPSAALSFYGAEPLNTEHDSTSPTTMQSIAFYYGGYSLSARPGASVITLTGNLFSDTSAGVSDPNGQPNTISLPLYFDAPAPANVNTVQVNGSDTLVLSGHLSGGSIRKDGMGTLVMSGDHNAYKGAIDVDVGTLLLGSGNGLGNDERISVREGAVLDLNNYDATLYVIDSRGEIRLGNGNLTLHGQYIQIHGDISGTGGLIVSETVSDLARVYLDGKQNFTGPTRLLSGILEIDGSSARSPITISSGGSLYGRGVTGALTVRGEVHPGGKLGLIAPGVLTSNGDVDFLPGSLFTVRLDGLELGGSDGYDQLRVNGRVDLSGRPKLKASVGFASKPGDTFTILTSTDGITGTFAGLPDGANLGINGTPMQIHYTANSVFLTHRPQFAPPVLYAAGRGPTLVATGDFRGKGIQDLVTANYSQGTVNVLLGNGDGSFQPAVSYAVSNVPTSLTVGDFNGDGHLDLVTTSIPAGVPSLSLLLGNGDGTFQAVVISPLDLQVGAVATGDFNHDGSLDLVTTNLYDGTVGVLLGNGDGTFQTAVTYAVSRASNALVVADLGNGQLDIVTAGYANGSVLLGNGDGTFQAALNFEIGTPYFTSLALRDFDGDGQLDLIATANSFADSSVHLFLGNGDGTFARAPQGRIFVGDQPGDVAVADFDGDGKLDFVVTTNYPSYRGLALLYGQGDGTFGAPSYYYLTPGLFSLAVDSFQGTRFPDVAVINDAVLSVLLNVGDGGAVPPPPGRPAGRKDPGPAAALFPGDSFPPLAGVDAALLAWGTPANITTSLRALMPSLEVARLERFFAAATEQDHRFASPRSKPEALLAADDRWVDGFGKGGALVERTLSALRTA